MRSKTVLYNPRTLGYVISFCLLFVIIKCSLFTASSVLTNRRLNELSRAMEYRGLQIYKRNQ